MTDLNISGYALCKVLETYENPNIGDANPVFSHLDGLRITKADRYFQEEAILTGDAPTS